MPSPRTDAPRSWSDRLGWPRGGARGIGNLARRLNVRLVLALAVVTLVGLVTSGLAISQILPGYFIEQTRQRVETATGATAIDLQQRINEAETNTAMAAELRNTRILPASRITGSTDLQRDRRDPRRVRPPGRHGGADVS